MHLFAFLLSLPIFFGAILPLKKSWRWKAVLSLVLLVFAFKFQVTMFLGGGHFLSPRLPGWLILFLGWGYGVVLFFSAFMLLWLVIQGILLPFKKFSSSKRNQANLGLLLSAILCTSVALCNGLSMPQEHDITLSIQNLPEQAKGCRVAVLTDLHIDNITGRNRLRAIVKKTMAWKPDLILLVGDFVDGTVSERLEELRPLTELEAPLGVWGVPGNHEYYFGFQEWMNALESLGIKILLNESTLLSNGVAVAGIADPAAKRAGETPPDVKSALEGLPAETPVLFMSHQPRMAPEAAMHGVDAVFSGHTHGGMLVGMDLAVAALNSGFVSGEYRLAPKTRLFVCNGTGIWKGFPLRLGHPAEMLFVTLTTAAQQGD